MQSASSAQPAAPQPATAAAPAIDDPGPRVPEGFTPIFNGNDLTGWHVSRTNHHGTTPEFRVVHGMIVGTQSPRGRGGILLTDRKYRNVEVYMEVKPDWGCDSGLFLRSSEAGEAYQVTLDYLPGGAMGGIYGERLTGVGGPPMNTLTPEERAKRLAELPRPERGVAEGVEARSVEHDPGAHRRRRPAHHRVDQRPGRHGLHGYGEPRRGWRDRRHDRDPDALLGREDAKVGGGRVLAVARDCGQGTARQVTGRDVKGPQR